MTKRNVNHVAVVVRTELPLSAQGARELVNDVLNDNEYKFTSPTTFEAKTMSRVIGAARRSAKGRSKPTY